MFIVDPHKLNNGFRIPFQDTFVSRKVDMNDFGRWVHTMEVRGEKIYGFWEYRLHFTFMN